MPTDLEHVTARKLETEGKQTQLAIAMMLGCLFLCFVTISIAVESAVYEAAIISSGELE